VTALLSLSTVRFVGRISYSLYLWHWPVYTLLRWTVGVDTLILRVLAIAATFVFAIASYLLIEQPFRQSAVLRALPRPAVVAILALFVLVGSKFSAATFNRSHKLSLSVTQNGEIWSPYFLGQTPEGCRVERGDGDLQGEGEITIRSSGCGKSAGGLMFVAGDSHAGAYTRMLAKLAEQKNFEIRLYSKPGCPFMNFKATSKDMDSRCAVFGREVAAKIESAIRPGDFVFLPSLRVARYRDQWGGGIAEDIQNHPIAEAAIQEATRFIGVLSDRGARVILEAPLPLFKSPPFRCSDWFNRGNPICTEGFIVYRKDEEGRRSLVVAIEREIAATTANVTVWDPLAILCGPQVCSAYKDGIPLFFDGDHLSGAGNLLLYESFRDHVGKYSRTNSAKGEHAED
jgi:hypothetical protein